MNNINIQVYALDTLRYKRIVGKISHIHNFQRSSQFLSSFISTKNSREYKKLLKLQIHATQLV